MGGRRKRAAGLRESPRLTIAVIAIALFSDQFPYGIVIPLLGHAGGEGASQSALGLAYGAYALAQILTVPLFGVLSDRFGRRRAVGRRRRRRLVPRSTACHEPDHRRLCVPALLLVAARRLHDAGKRERCPPIAEALDRRRWAMLQSPLDTADLARDLAHGFQSLVLSSLA